MINNYYSVKDQCPNVILWSKDEIKFVELKTEKESLSSEKIFWIQQLKELELEAEVLSVIIDEN